MSIFNEDSFIYNPFGATATADNPTTAYKKQPDLQHAIGYDNSVSPDTDKEDYVKSREAAILKYLASHSEKSHTFRIKCDMPGDEDRPGAGIRKKLAIHQAHYVKFTRVPDLRQCTFSSPGGGRDQQTFKELFGKDYDDLSLSEKTRIEGLFKQMHANRDTTIELSYHVSGQDEPKKVTMHMGYSLVIENVDEERKGGLFPNRWDSKRNQREKREEELKEQGPARKVAAAAEVKYEDEKLHSGVMRMRWIDPRYDAVPPDELLSKEELDLKAKNYKEFNKTHSQIPADKLTPKYNEERKAFDDKILDRKYEMFQRLDHTGQFSDNLKTVERKDKLSAVGKNVKHETARTITNTVVRAPMTGAQDGASFIEQLLGRAMSAVQYR